MAEATKMKTAAAAVDLDSAWLLPLLLRRLLLVRACLTSQPFSPQPLLAQPASAAAALTTSTNERKSNRNVIFVASSLFISNSRFQSVVVEVFVLLVRRWVAFNVRALTGVRRSVQITQEIPQRTSTRVAGGKRHFGAGRNGQQCPPLLTTHSNQQNCVARLTRHTNLTSRRLARNCENSQRPDADWLVQLDRSATMTKSAEIQTALPWAGGRPSAASITTATRTSGI